MSNIIGQSVGRYHILEQLGEGGMATVYKAYDTRLERHVAVKVILPQKLHADKFVKRFDREAKALAQLSHPNIVKVIDYGDHEGQPYLVMEYIPGGTLKQKLAGGSIPWKQAIQILIPIARALSFAHQNKIIHRDVKSTNILITQNGEAMLSDFGIAKMLETDETLELTGTGIGVGTPEYMSPEQAQGKAVDERSDIYSLGIVLYEMITSRKPFQADTPIAVVWKLASEPLPSPKQFIKDLPDPVEGILLKALAKDPRHRFQNMDAMIHVWENLQTQNKFFPSLRLNNKSAFRWGLGVLLASIILFSVFNFVSKAGNAPAPTADLLQASTEIATIALPSPSSSATKAPTEISTLNFSDQFDGQNGINRDIWWEENQPPCKYTQADGKLVIDNELSQMDVDCFLTVKNNFPVQAKMFNTFEANILMADDHNGVLANQGLNISTDSLRGGNWWAVCGLLADQYGVSIVFDVTNYGSGKVPDILQKSPAKYNESYKIRLEFDWDTMQISCLVNDELFASVIPSDKDELVNARYRFHLGAWRTPGSFVSSYFDDVLISP